MNKLLYQFSAYEVVSLIRKGEISPIEAVKASIQRIEETDSLVNALPIRCFDRALNKAKHMDLKSEKENPKSLMGLPIAVKDYNDIGGVKTTYGSKIFANNIPKVSDETVLQLEKNGANPIGKSNVPEWAGGHTFNPVFGVTSNPFNIKKTAGGSSGGSAASLASGQVWLATGNDLGGSLRTPASFNNVVGLRPSPGIVPRGVRLNPFDTLWVEGPMARSVKDLALMLDAGAGYSINDPLSSDHKQKLFFEEIQKYKLPKRIAFSVDLGGIIPVSKEIIEATTNAVKRIKLLGIEVSDQIPDFSKALDGFHTLRSLLLATMLDDLIKTHRNQILPDIVKNAENGFNLRNRDIIDAEKIRKNIVNQMQSFFKNHDFLICPASSVAPFDIEKPFIKEIDGQPCKTYIDWFAITFALTMTGCPVISLPCGFTKDGLPVGIQILGKPHQEGRLLDFAWNLESIFGVSQKVPIEKIK